MRDMDFLIFVVIPHIGRDREKLKVQFPSLERFPELNYSVFGFGAVNFVRSKIVY